MSIKINKNNKEYPLGVIPQSLYDDVEELKDAVDNIPTKISDLTNDVYSALTVGMINTTVNANTTARVSDDGITLNKGRYLIVSSSSMIENTYGANFTLRVNGTDRMLSASKANLIGAFTVESDNSPVYIAAINWSSSAITFSRNDPVYKYWQIIKIGEYNT